MPSSSPNASCSGSEPDATATATNSNLHLRQLPEVEQHDGRRSSSLFAPRLVFPPVPQDQQQQQQQQTRLSREEKVNRFIRSRSRAERRRLPPLKHRTAPILELETTAIASSSAAASSSTAAVSSSRLLKKHKSKSRIPRHAQQLKMFATPSYQTPIREAPVITTPIRPNYRELAKETQREIQSALNDNSAEALKIVLCKKHRCPKPHALHEAIRRFNPAAVRLLLDDNANVNQCCESIEQHVGLTPLHLAVQMSSQKFADRSREGLQIVKLLLHANALPDVFNSSNCLQEKMFSVKEWIIGRNKLFKQNKMFSIYR